MLGGCGNRRSRVYVEYIIFEVIRTDFFFFDFFF
jgi:hypothetical protein